MNSTVKTIMFWVFILVCLMLLLDAWWQKSASMGKATEIGYSDLLDKIEAGRCRTPPSRDRAARPPEGRQGSVPHHDLRQQRRQLDKELRASKVNFNIKEPQSNMLCRC